MTCKYKLELDSYQLKEVDQVWYTQWKDSRSVESGPIEWEAFVESFLGKYFPRKKREVNVEEFINLREGNMRVEECSLKVTLFSKYSQSFVSNPRTKMTRFMTGVGDNGRINSGKMIKFATNNGRIVGCFNRVL